MAVILDQDMGKTVKEYGTLSYRVLLLSITGKTIGAMQTVIAGPYYHHVPERREENTWTGVNSFCETFDSRAL